MVEHLWTQTWTLTTKLGQQQNQHSIVWKNIARIRGFLTKQDSEKAVHASY